MNKSILIEDFKNIENNLIGIIDKFINKKFLIVGGTGFIGTYLSEFLNYINLKNSLNMEITVITRRQNVIVNDLNFGIKYVKHDIKYQLSEDLNSYDFVFHLASKASPKNYQTNKIDTIESNLIGIKNILDILKLSNKSKLLYLSSSEVYGDNITSSEPIDELTFFGIDPLSPRAAYAESKRISETYIKSFSDENFVNFNIIRPFHTFGPYIDLQDGRVFSDFINSIINESKIYINSDGTAKRSFCYISDAVYAYLLVALNGKFGHAYNVGNPQNYVSILDLATELKDKINDRSIEIVLKKNIVTKIQNSKVINSNPSVKKIEDLGWKSNVNLIEGFRRTINFYSN